MDYSTAYSKSLQKQIKYGKADPERTKDFVTQGLNSGQLEPNNFHDQLLADHLHDAEDPHHAIVMADLDMRKQPGDTWGAQRQNALKQKMEEPTIYSLSCTSPKIIRDSNHPEGSLSATSWKNLKGKQLIETTWRPRTQENSASIYEGFLEPEEFDKLAEHSEFPQRAADLLNVLLILLMKDILNYASP